MANLTIFVYVIGLGIPFTVDIKRSKTVGHLEQVVLRRKPTSNDLEHIDANRLVLYKVELPAKGEDLERLASQALGENLGVASKLSEIFSM
jgi:hypothetical protein